MFNPSSITNCSFWLDPTFSNGLTFVNGTQSTVSQLNSRIDSNQYFYSLSSNRFFLSSNTSVLNNKNSLFWSGDSYGLAGGTGFGTTSPSGWTIAAVYRSLSSSTGSQTLIRGGAFALGPNQGASAFGLGVNAANPNRPFISTLDNTIILIAVYENSSTFIYTNGIQQSTIEGQSFGSYNYWDLGDARNYGVSGSFKGYTGDIITYDKALTTSERTDLYTYLYQKWLFDPTFPPIPYPVPRVKSNALQFWWRAPIAYSTNITSYTITDDTITTHTSSTQFSATIGNLTPGNSYSFKIFATSPDGNTISSFFKSVSTCVRPQPPTDLSYTSVGNNGYVFSWSNPTDTGNGTLLGTCLSFIPANSNVSKLSALGKDTTSAFTYLPSGSTFIIGFQSVNDSSYSLPAYLSTILT